MAEIDYLVLGYGYTAKYFESHLKKEDPLLKMVSTSRSGDPHIAFDLMDPSSWSNLPSALNLVWTFPPSPLEQVQKFYESHGHQYKNIIVVGSTSALKVEQEDQWVDEKTPFDLTIERVKAENYLLNQGARLVLSSGIYGVGRNPLSWIEKGMVGRNKKFVNMIHVEDLCQFIYLASVRGENSQVYIASDNNPRRWTDIIEDWQRSGLVKGVAEKLSQRPSKRISCDQSIKALQVELIHDNFTETVIKLGV